MTRQREGMLRSRPRTDWLLLAVHSLLLAGYVLPWVQGSFGSRTDLSGVDVGRLAVAALTGEPEVSTWTLLLLASLPALAADGLMVSALGDRLGFGRCVTRSLAVTLALPGVLLAASILTLTLLAAGGSLLIDGPASGLYLQTAAGVVLLGALLSPSPRRLQRPHTATSHRTAPASPSAWRSPSRMP